MRKHSIVILAVVLMVAATGVAQAQTDPDAIAGQQIVDAVPLAGGAWGMDFDEQGELWVGQIGTRSISRIDPDTGDILEQFGPEDGAEGPDDLAVGPDGAIYYTAILTGEVGRLDPDDGQHTTVANLGPGVNPITFSDDGRLFVGKAVIGQGLFEVDPDGENQGVDDVRIIRDDSRVNAFDWWDGHLYAPEPVNGEVVRIDVDTGTFTPVVEGLDEPGAVDIARDGRMYVLTADQVLEFDPASGDTTLIGTVPARDNMAIDADGRIFVSGGNNGAIYRVQAGQETVVVSPGGLSAPQGLTATEGPDGHDLVYAADQFLTYGFDGRTGSQVFVTGAGEAPGEDAEEAPVAATIDERDGNLVVSSYFTNQVTVWDPEQQATVAAQPAPVPINAVGFGDDLVVAQLGTDPPNTSSVVRYDPDGTATTLTSQVVIPAGLAATDDDLWVADWATGTVQQLVRDGVELDEPAAVIGGLANPEGMAVTTDGDLVVVETGVQQLTLLDLDATPVTRTTLVSDLPVGQPAPPGTPPTWGFDGVAVGPSGAIYVSADGIRRYDTADAARGERIAGDDRYDTAAQIALATFDTATDVVLATGLDYPDALAASGLAGLVDAPVLLTERDALPSATTDALDALSPDVVHVLGGTAAISQSVEDALDASGYETPRIGGEDRYATAARIADAIGPDAVGERTAIVATGTTFPDALAAGPVAFAGVHPVLLVDDEVPSEVENALTSLEITDVVIVGGPAAVSTDVEAELAAITGDDAVTRLAGDNRYATATAIAEYAGAQAGFDLSQVLVANGVDNSGVDALAGGPYGGTIDAPVVLVTQDAVPTATSSLLTEQCPTVDTVWALGGESVISSFTWNAITAIASCQ